MWSIICLIVTSFALLTFIIQPKRFRWPARPVLYLTSCGFVASTVYLFKWIAGPLICSGKSVSVLYESKLQTSYYTKFILISFVSCRCYRPWKTHRQSNLCRSCIAFGLLRNRLCALVVRLLPRVVPQRRKGMVHRSHRKDIDPFARRRVDRNNVFDHLLFALE